MRNAYLLMPDYYGHIVPELWYLYTRNGSLFFNFTPLCWELLKKDGVRNDVAFEPPSTEKGWGFEGAFRPVKARRDGRFTLVVPINDQVDQKKRENIADSLSFFTAVLDIQILPDACRKGNKKDEEQVQLFSLETIHRNDTHFHAAAADLTVSPVAGTFLLAHSEERIPGARRAMKEHWGALFPDIRKRKEYMLSTDLSGVVREYGTLSFTSIGNCACMGAMPEKPQPGHGMYIDSHNLDTSWQQLNMLAGIAAMWRWVRKSLNYK
jgi:hypothetical protein